MDSVENCAKQVEVEVHTISECKMDSVLGEQTLFLLGISTLCKSTLKGPEVVAELIDLYHKCCCSS